MRGRDAVLGLAIAVAGCSADSNDAADGGAPKCIVALPLDCHPTYPPTYDLIYESLLRPTCAVGTGGTCHAGPTPDKARAGLVLSDRDGAFDYLLGKVDGRARVVRGKPECSILMQRLDSIDPDFRMPSGGDQLSIDDRCPIRQWIAAGAKRR